MRLALIGWGAIGRTVAEKIAGFDIDIVAIGVRDTGSERVGLPAGAAVIDDASQLAATDPELVVEAAGRASVGPWGRATLAAGADYVVSSVSAFADDVLLADLRAASTVSSGQLIIQPGALAGVEALAAATHMGVDVVEHRIIKPPRAWLGTPAERLCELDALAEPTEFFRASARTTASEFPKNANVAMTTALAGVGPDATEIALIADPTAVMNRHEVSAHGPFGRLDVAVANNPLPANPKSSALAALSLVRLIQNRTAAIAI